MNRKGAGSAIITFTKKYGLFGCLFLAMVIALVRFNIQAEKSVGDTIQPVILGTKNVEITGQDKSTELLFESLKNPISGDVELLSSEVFVPLSKNYDDDWCHPVELKPKSFAKAWSEVSDFYQNRGYFELDVLPLGDGQPEFTSRYDPSYDGYSAETLKALGEQGDRKALLKLYDHPDVSFEQQVLAANQSFLYGDTALTSSLASLYILEAVSSSNKSEETEQSKLLLLTGMTIAIFGEKRGDPSVLPDLLADFDDDYFNLWGNLDPTLSQTDIEFIHLSAQALHDKINQDREGLGLMPLNNEVPQIMQYFKNSRVAGSLIDSKVPTLVEPFITNLDCINAIKSTLEQDI